MHMCVCKLYMCTYIFTLYPYLYVHIHIDEETGCRISKAGKIEDLLGPFKP